MKEKTIVIVVIALGILASTQISLFLPYIFGTEKGNGTQPPPNANLLFKSSFETPVYHEHVSGDTFLHGADQGFEWYGMLGYNVGHMGNYNHGVIGVDVDMTVTSTRAHSGTKSLGLAVYTPWSNSGYAHRSQLNVYTKYADYPKLFVRRWLWLPPDMKLPPNGAMVGIAGHREVDPDHAVGLSIGMTSDGSKMYFYTRGIYPTPSNPNTEWRYNDLDTTVPLGRWFKVEDYIEFSKTNGVYKVWIDDKLIFDVSGKPTLNLETEIMHNRIAKVYVGHSGLTYTYPYYLYADDVEIWDGIP